MNETVRQRLCDLVAQQGRTLVQDARRCESLVRDFCGTTTAETKVLLLAIKEQVPHDLLAHATDPWPTVLSRLSQKLQQGLAMEAVAATWAIESWAIALGVISGVDTTRPGPRRHGVSETLAGRGTTTPVSNSPPLIVSKLGPEHFHTIGEAIQKARPGTRILVLPGIYNEAIVLDKSVEIVGEGSLSEVMVQNATGGCCLTMQTDYAVVRNLTLRGRAALVNKSVVTVNIPQGRLILENCDVSSDTNAGIFIHGTLANPVIRFCEIHDIANGSGIFCDKQSEGVIEDCNIHDNARAQVVVQGGSTCAFRRCHIHDGKADGIGVRAKGQGTFEDCLIWSNASEGMEIQSESNPTVRRSEIHGNGRSGVIFREKAKGTLENCHIHSNGESQAQVAIQDESEPILRKCKIGNGKGVGVSVQKKAKGLLEDCEVAESAGVGVWIGEESDPTFRRCIVRDGKVNGIVVNGKSKGILAECEVVRHLQQYPSVVIRDNSSPQLSRCRVHDSGSTGVWIREKGSGTLRDCEIYDTASSGVEIGEESSPILNKCVVRNSQATGVLVRGKSRGVLEECQIVSNAQAGITVQEGGNPELRNCKINGNGYEAVWIKAESTATVAECDLSGNKRGAWDIHAGCLVRRTGNHVEGQEFLDVTCDECGEDFEAERAGRVTCPDPECRTNFVVDDDGNAVEEEIEEEEVEDEDEDEDEEFDDEDEGTEQALVVESDNRLPLSEQRRKEIFAALITAQDQGLAIPVSKRTVASRFTLSEDQLRAIEDEGIDKEWPPL